MLLLSTRRLGSSNNPILWSSIYKRLYSSISNTVRMKLSKSELAKSTMSFFFNSATRDVYWVVVYSLVALDYLLRGLDNLKKLQAVRKEAIQAKYKRGDLVTDEEDQWPDNAANLTDETVLVEGIIAKEGDLSELSSSETEQVQVWIKLGEFQTLSALR